MQMNVMVPVERHVSINNQEVIPSRVYILQPRHDTIGLIVWHIAVTNAIWVYVCVGIIQLVGIDALLALKSNMQAVGHISCRAMKLLMPLKSTMCCCSVHALRCNLYEAAREAGCMPTNEDQHLAYHTWHINYFASSALQEHSQCMHFSNACVDMEVLGNIIRRC